jgi:hypothetical protein
MAWVRERMDACSDVWKVVHVMAAAAPHKAASFFHRAASPARLALHQELPMCVLG